jgi:hypothetical protein
LEVVSFVLLGSIFASGIMAHRQMYRVGRVMETLRNMWTLVKRVFCVRLEEEPANFVG